MEVKWLVARQPVFYAEMWEVETGKLLYKFEGGANGVHSVAFSPDGKVIALGLQ